MTCPCCKFNVSVVQNPWRRQRRLCGRCQQKLPAFDQVFAAYQYAQPVQSMLTAFKYQRRQVLGRVLAETAAGHIADAIVADDLPLPQALVPVPLHRWRLLRRGFNQSFLIARDIQRHLQRRDLPTELTPSMLARVRRTQPQAGLDLAARGATCALLFVCMEKCPRMSAWWMMS